MSLKFEEVITRLGQPDADHSTQDDEPRPPIVTRWIIYRKPKVRITFVPTAKTGTPPPYKEWILFAVQDSATDAPLTIDEANRRFREAGVI